LANPSFTQLVFGRDAAGFVVAIHNARIIHLKKFLRNGKKSLDAAGVQVGDLIVMNNITEEKKTQKLLMISIGSGTLSILSLLFIFIFLLLRRTDMNISAQEAELISANSNMNTLLSTIPAFVYFKDISLKYMTVNKALAEMVGVTKDEMIGKSDLDFFPKEQADADRIDDVEVIATGRPLINIEKSLTGRNGKTLQVTTSKRPIYDENGYITGLVGMAVDITERKLIEKSLRASEARYRLLADNVSDIIWTRDLDLKLTYVSPSVEKHSGFSAEEKMKQPLEQSMPASSVEKSTRLFFEELALAQEENADPGRSVMIELDMYKKDGSIFPVESTVSFLRNDNGRIIGILGVNRDITRRKHTEKELLEANEYLEHQTAIANDMMAQAEMASITKSEFLANMSHEIRTPMNGVVGMAELLMGTNLDDIQYKYAKIVKSSGESLLDIINDILDFSKIEAGKMDLEELDFDLRGLLDDFADTMAFRAEEKGLELICSVAPEVHAFFRGDPGRLRQILINLTGNSIKFTEKGEISILCRIEKELQDSCKLHFSVRDTGIGIPKEKQNILFDKFTQADGSITREFGGTGLGLTISQQLSEMMGGKIGIESIEGKGSTFWFTVELKNSDTKPEPLNIGDLENAKIILMDDNATNLEAMSVILSSWGIEHALAQKGSEGLGILYEAVENGSPFDIAVLDLKMPEMDGATVGKIIKNDEKLENTRILLLTSIGWRGDAALYKKEGFDAFLTKPLHQSTLYECLAHIMGISTKSDYTNKTYLITRHSISESRKAKTRLLLVEDNSTNRVVATEILKKIGYSADIATNGLEALKALEANPYDLVFMDIQMPEMDGLKATRILRDPESYALNHDTPVVAMTANAMQGDREKYFDAGMNDYITKPIGTETVNTTLEKWLPKTWIDDIETDDSIDNLPVENFTDNSEKPPLFDTTEVLKRLGDDKELLQTLCSHFLVDILNRIKNLKENLKSKDLKSLTIHAHTIKGASANIGGNLLREIAGKIEEYGSYEDLGALEETIPELETEFYRLKTAMNEYFGTVY